MDDKLSQDAIAIVASNLAAAQIAAGFHKIDAADPAHGILSLYWDYVGELSDAAGRERRSQR